MIRNVILWSHYSPFYSRSLLKFYPNSFSLHHQHSNIVARVVLFAFFVFSECSCQRLIWPGVRTSRCISGPIGILSLGFFCVHEEWCFFLWHGFVCFIVLLKLMAWHSPGLISHVLTNSCHSNTQLELYSRSFVLYLPKEMAGISPKSDNICLNHLVTSQLMS